MKTFLCGKPLPLCWTLASAAVLAGCALTSDIPASRVAMPDNWQETARPADAAAIAAAPLPALSSEWWQGFGSDELTRLIALALAESPDLAIAMERVRQAEAQLKGSNASLFPVLGLSGSTGRRRSDGGPDEASTRSDSTGVSLTASYEIDLWGGNAASRRASRASLLGSRYDHETVRLTLVSGVADAYFQVLSLRTRLTTARENLAIAERVFKVVDARARHGAASALDVSRQQATVLSQRAAVLPLELQERQTLAGLAILIGRVPQGFDVTGTSLADLAVPAIDPGLPAELLTRRPDLASAEARLIAANADITIARAALLPGVSLAASAGSSSGNLASLAASTTTTGITLSLMQTIFDGGRLRSQVDIAKSRERELVENYRAAILSALADVDNALTEADRSTRQELLQAQIRDEAVRSLRLAEVRYKEGADDLLTVLDAQRTLFSAQDQLEQLRLSRLSAAISLFKALGGGWERTSIDGQT